MERGVYCVVTSARLLLLLCLPVPYLTPAVGLLPRPVRVASSLPVLFQRHSVVPLKAFKCNISLAASAAWCLLSQQPSLWLPPDTSHDRCVNCLTWSLAVTPRPPPSVTCLHACWLTYAMLTGPRQWAALQPLPPLCLSPLRLH